MWTLYIFSMKDLYIYIQYREQYFSVSPLRKFLINRNIFFSARTIGTPLTGTIYYCLGTPERIRLLNRWTLLRGRCQSSIESQQSL